MVVHPATDPTDQCGGGAADLTRPTGSSQLNHGLGQRRHALQVETGQLTAAGVGRQGTLRAELAGPDDTQPWLTDADHLRALLRDVFSAAGGTHDDWDEYDRVMAAERRAVVLIAPTRVYSNG